MKNIILLFFTSIAALFTFSSCTDRLNIVFTDYYVCIKDEYGASSSNIDASVEIYFPISSIEYPENVIIKPGTFINSGLQILSAGIVKIGKNCFIGPNCSLYTPNHHPYDKILRREGWQYDAGITIGDDCWFGGNVTVLPGVSLGDNVVVGAGSVITESFGDDAIIAGNPARIIKNL